MEAAWHAKTGQPTFQYQFERSVPGREALGSTHGAEVPFVFGTLDRSGPDAPAYAEADRNASALMQQYWTRFAATGDPNGPGLPPWPRAGDGRYMAFTAAGPQVKANLQAAACGVFRQWAMAGLSK
jgi:para-nitrobenzyl esterase